MPSENTSSRKLAAILFADIAGYTALMQKNENQASTLLRRFQTSLKSEVAAHQGEVVNFYGDGALCTFNSPLEAMQCAIKLQSAFQSEPIVPVRIGIHSGTVVYEGDKVFGDSVNVASRIESMGIPGSILVSKKVRNDLKNQPDLLLPSLGSFEFKNVEEPMEVFALANEGFVVPTRLEMKGKGKAASKGSNKLWYFLIPLLLLISFFGIYQWQQQSTFAPKISQDIRNERIAVLPFKNNTNDADLDVLGDMSADWINRGLMEIEDIEITSPFTVRSNLAALGIGPNDPEGRKSFSELTGAQNMLSGNYYEESGDIIFQLQIESATDGKIRFIFNPIRGPKENKEALLSQLGSQVAGYWVSRALVDSKNIQAPKYEAYVAYNKALLNMNSAAEFSKVFELDSTFYLARLHFLNSNRYGLFQNNRNHFDFLNRHASELSSYETTWLNFLKGLYLGDNQQAFRSLNNLRKKYPKDFMINHETASIADDAFNNPELVLEIYSELPIEEVDGASVGVYYTFRILHQVNTYIKLGQYSDLEPFLSTVKVAQETVKTAYIAALLTKSLAESNPDQIDNAYAQFLKIYDYDKLGFFYWSLMYYNSPIGSPIRDRLRSDYLSNYQKLDPADFGRSLYKPFIALISEKSLNISIDEIKKLPKIMAINSLYAEGEISGKNDNYKTQYLMNELINYTPIDYDMTSAAGPGQAHYYLGKLFTKMGKRDNAIKHFKEARRLGHPVWLTNYKYDLDLASFVGIPEFDALTDPIWPEVKD